MKNLYERHNYLNKSILIMKSVVIREYDMKDAGFTIIKNESLFSKETIEKIERMDKHSKNVFIGKILRDDVETSNRIMKEFISIRKKFFELNDIHDEEILSIKKDAIFTINKICKNTSFDGYEFRNKGKYSSYMNINNKEFYYSSWKDTLDTKGFGKETLLLHKDYFLKDIKRIMKMYEKLPHNQMIKILSDYRFDYLNRNIPIENYRELNSDSKFRLNTKIGGSPFYIDDLTDGDMSEYLDIGYNFTIYVIPMIGLMI